MNEYTPLSRRKAFTLTFSTTRGGHRGGRPPNPPVLATLDLQIYNSIEREPASLYICHTFPRREFSRCSKEVVGIYFKSSQSRIPMRPFLLYRRGSSLWSKPTWFESSKCKPKDPCYPGPDSIPVQGPVPSQVPISSSLIMQLSPPMSRSCPCPVRSSR